MANLTPELEAALHNVFHYASENRHEVVTAEHLLFQILDTPSGIKTLEAVRADIKQLRADLAEYLDTYIPKLPASSSKKPEHTGAFSDVLQRAIFQVSGSGRSEVSVNEILISLFGQKDSHALYLLGKQGIKRIDVVNFVAKGVAPGASGAPVPEGAEEHGEDGENQVNPLDAFAENLNRRASEGRIDPLVGRDEEVERTIQILCRRRKNNPLLVGEAGVGKTAIAEGLAKRIVEGTVPSVLADCEIYALDLGSLVAGTKYRGDFEQRIKAVVSKLKKDPKKILFIDEIHTLIGAGASGGGNMDASNLLKPALSSGELRCIGATTHQEFRTIFEKEHALARRFQKVDIGEPSIDDTIKILTGLKDRYEKHHGVTYTAESIEAAARLASRFIPDRHMPDKAIDVLDEAGARQRTLPEGQAKTEIGIPEIEAVVAKIARVPTGSVSQSDRERLRTLDASLKNAVFGQDPAADMLARAIKRSRADLGRKNKPIGSFLFAGPTGVGKTEITKQLADTMGLPLVRFDMSEYMEKHAVAKLIGAPPGYVGFEGGGQLTEAINKHPYCVLLLDEIEKAHPDIFNILLQAMDNASMTDNNGRAASFKNVIIVMTTNTGAEASERMPIGFSQVPTDTQNAARDAALKGKFSPEFRNRLDAVIQFSPLSPEVIMKVAEKQLTILEAELRSRDEPVSAIFSDALKAHLAKAGFDPKNGARPMERLIQDTIRDALADELLFGDLQQGGEVEIDVATAADGSVKVVHKVTQAGSAPKKNPPRSRKKIGSPS